MGRIFAALLIVLTSPLVIAVGFLIKWKYPGPMFYTQIREGKNGRAFKIVKMRTMVSNAGEILQQLLKNNPELAKSWAETGVLKNDPRIAGRLGRLSRQLSIDELPQLLNVLKGEMAFVGPRPLEIPSVEAFPPQTRAFRNSVLPGITGLSQIYSRDATLREMLFFDRIYIKRQSFGLDLFIIYRTFFAIFRRTGA